MKEILEFFGTNPTILGIASLCGILGFILTIKVACQTRSIHKILQYNDIASQYNKERAALQKAFEGHRLSIVEDHLKTDKLLNDILRHVEEYRAKFWRILSLSEKCKILFFSRCLKKEAINANWNSICNYLAFFSGRLSKKEEQKNG